MTSGIMVLNTFYMYNVCGYVYGWIRVKYYYVLMYRKGSGRQAVCYMNIVVTKMKLFLIEFLKLLNVKCNGKMFHGYENENLNLNWFSMLCCV